MRSSCCGFSVERGNDPIAVKQKFLQSESSQQQHWRFAVIGAGPVRITLHWALVSSGTATTAISGTLPRWSHPDMSQAEISPLLLLMEGVSISV